MQTQPCFPGLEDDLEPDDLAREYRGLTDDHALVVCPCGRELLAANLPGEAYRGFRESESDALPPLAFRWRRVGPRRVPQCCPCYVAERRAARQRG